MKKLLSVILSVAMLCTMCVAFGVTASAADEVIEVSTESEFTFAVNYAPLGTAEAHGALRKIKLKNDIEVNSPISLVRYATVEIDLDGHTLTVPCLYIGNSSTDPGYLTLKNGSVNFTSTNSASIIFESSIAHLENLIVTAAPDGLMGQGNTFENNGTMTIDNCQLISSSSDTNGRQPVLTNNASGTITITNSTLTAGSYDSSADLRPLVLGAVSAVTDGDGVALNNTSKYNLNADELVVGTGYTPWENKITEIGDERHSDVKGTYVAGSTAATVYSVDISWGDMEFTYTDASEGTWNPATHSYSGSTPAGWTVNNADGNKITITNHSNVGVTATLAYEKGTGYEGISGSFTEAVGTANDGVMILASAAGTARAEAPSASASLALSGELSSTATTASTIGTVKVTLS